MQSAYAYRDRFEKQHIRFESYYYRVAARSRCAFELLRTCSLSWLVFKNSSGTTIYVVTDQTVAVHVGFLSRDQPLR